MTIAQFEDKIESCVTGKFFAGRKNEYNREKLISDITILVPPREWPLNWREGCYYDIEVELWIGKVRNPKDATLTKFRDDLNAEAVTLIGAIHLLDGIHVLSNDVNASYWSSDEGQSVNSQEFISFTLPLRIWTG